MTIKLSLAKRKVDCIIQEFGAEKVTIIDTDGDGYVYFSVELEHSMDALKFFHAGEEAGLVLGLYGLAGRPKKEEAAVA